MKYCFTILFFVLVLFAPAHLVAQSNFKKGLVVTSAGDTLKGYIDYQEWLKNPKSISFKPDLSQKAGQAFTPVNSSYFELENLAAYQTYQGMASADRTDFNNIPKTIDTSKVFVQAFLKVLSKGEHVTLFMLSDEIKVRFFLKENKENNMQELGFRRYVDPERDDKIRASKNYMGQLWLIASNYQVASPGLKRQIELATYTSTDLTKIVEIINKSDKSAIQNKAAVQNYRLFAGAGLNQSTTRMVGKHELAHPEAVNQTSVFPKIIVGADMFLNPQVRRVVLRSEFSLTKTHQKISRQYDNVSETQEFKQNIFTFFPQVLYNLYNRENARFFIGSGLSASIVSYPLNYYLRATSYINGATYRLEGENHYLLEKFWYLVPVKAGLTLRRLEVAAIYFPPVAITKYHNFVLETKSVHLQMNYLLNK